jgi:Tol biopolymer transport system component
MSPEQARGEPVDKRGDVWAFGVVLWEMLTGKHLYHGKTTSDVLAAVIRDEPDLTQVPAKVRPLLKRCLEKEPQNRLRDIGDAMAIIESAPEGVEVRTSWLPWGIAALLLAALGAVSFLHFRETPPEARLITTSIEAPENTTFEFTFGLNLPTLSPDGRRIVFGARGPDGKTQLWVRALASPAVQQLAGTEGGVRFPFWSPDSRAIAFFADGKLKRVDVTGGPVLALADAPNPVGGSWSPQGVIVFSSNFEGAFQRVGAGGGVPIAATRYEPGHHYYSPWFLPDGRHFLFADQGQTGSSDIMLRIGALDSLETKMLGRANSNAIYSSGNLLYLRQNTLMAQPFDEKRLATTGDAVPLAEQVRTMSPDITLGIFSVARESLLAYQTAGAGGDQLTWFDRSGKPLGTLGDPGEFVSLEFSPDRKRVAVTLRGQDDDIWIYDVAREVPMRFTYSPQMERVPVWSPDGRSIVYTSNAQGHFDLYRKSADGTGNEELLYADGEYKIPSSWSPDGKLLLFSGGGPKDLSDICVLPTGAPSASGSGSKPLKWLATPFREAAARFSPDGQWVSYESNESGRNEIYAAPFPGPGSKRRISNGGGRYPRWRADGKEVFYVGPGTLMAAEVSIKGGNIEVGAVHSLGIPVRAAQYRYDVSLDGQRFLVAAPREQKSPAPLTLVQNWTALLKKK